MANYAFPLKRATGKRYLVDQNGTPFLQCGESPWSAFTVLNSTDFTTYCNGMVARQAQSGHIELIDNTWTDSYVNGAGFPSATNDWGADVNGNLPFLKDQSGANYTLANGGGYGQSPDFTPSNMNSAYWTEIDNKMSIAASFTQINWNVYLFWIGNPIPGYPAPQTEGYYAALNAQSATIRQNFAAAVANRYKSIKNLIWVVGGDNNPANSAVVTDFVTGIQSVDTSHLITFDGLDGTSPLSTTQAWPATFVTNGVNNVYTDIDAGAGHPYTYAQCKTEYQRTDYPGVPYFQKEGAYQNGQAGWTSQLVRAQSAQAWLGGACGYHWGSQPAWYFGSGWQADYSTSRASLDHQVLNRFLLSRRWWLLIPDWGNLFLTNGGSYTNASFVSAASASDGSWGALYTQSNVSLTVNLAMFSDKVTVYWMDPTNGSTQLVGYFSPSGSHTFASTPGTNAQGDADWYLIFETTLPTTAWMR